MLYALCLLDTGFSAYRGWNATPTVVRTGHQAERRKAWVGRDWGFRIDQNLQPFLYKRSPIRNSQCAFRSPILGWLGFCTLKKPQKWDQFSNKDKTYQLQIYVCYCFIGKNYLLFIFLVFLLSWKKPKSTDNLFTDKCPVADNKNIWHLNGISIV